MRSGLLLFLLLIGCANNVGPTGVTVGAACVDTFDCSAGSFCITGAGFPGGTCTRNCASTAPCPGGSVCADVRGGVCAVTCSTTSECRMGYACEARSVASGGMAMICIGP